MAARRLNKLKVALAAMLLAITALLIYQFGLFVMVLWLSMRNPSASAFMNQTLTKLRAEDADAAIRHEWVPYAQISENLKRAVVASEDSQFTAHGGVEWDDIRRAWEYNRRQASLGKDKRRGGSTITQQLAKNLFLSSERSYWRKGQELILTYMMELVMSKERILELYLNVAQWGKDVFGAQAAARHYFGTTAARLSSSQAARLASMLPNPVYYEAHRNSNYLARRTGTIQQRMRLVDVP